MISEEQLKAAAQEAGEALLDSLPNRDQCSHTFSPKFERRMKGLLQKNRHPTARRTLGRVAGVLLALLVSSAIWLSVDAEARGIAAGWFRQAYKTVFVYRFAGSAESVDKDVKYAPTWLPEDWIEADRWDDNTGVTIFYDNGTDVNNYFSYIYAPTESDYRGLYLFDDAIPVCATVGGSPAGLFLPNEDDAASTLIWSDSETGILFLVSGDLEQETLIRIAESVCEEIR